MTDFIELNLDLKKTIVNYHKESSLKQKICSVYGIESNAITIDAGAELSLKNLFQQFALKGDYTIIIPEISWSLYKDLINYLNLDFVTFKCIKGEDAFSFDYESLFDLLEKHPKSLVVLNLPSNPLGISLNFNSIKKISEFLRQGQFLLIDECYFGFNNEEIDLLNYINDFKNLVVIRTFSKYYGLAGLRIGYTVVCSELIEKIGLYQNYLGNNIVSELIALKCLENNSIFKNFANNIIEEREKLHDFFNNLTDFKAYKSVANFLLVEILNFDKTEFFTFLKTSGIIVKSMEDSLIKNCVRITIGTANQMEILKEKTLEFIKQHEPKVCEETV
jgi:histidinol-phosphate aminotransferase